MSPGCRSWLQLSSGVLVYATAGCAAWSTVCCMVYYEAPRGVGGATFSPGCRNWT